MESTLLQRLKEKKRIKEGKETADEKDNRERLSQLTELADAILTRSGDNLFGRSTYPSTDLDFRK